jgi:hypothetical protein
MLAIILLSLIVGGENAKAQNQQLPSQDQVNSITITPELVSQIGGPMNAVALQDNYAYAGVGPRLFILDVSSPAQPVLTGRTGLLPGVIQDVTVVGNYAYVADGGLSIIDVTNPAFPIQKGFYDTPGDYSPSIAVSGDYAFIANYDRGVLIIDVTNPAGPIEIGSISEGCNEFGMPTLTCYIREVAVAGDYAYVGGNYCYTMQMKYCYPELRIYDISSPATPLFIGSLQMGGLYEPGVNRLVLAGNYAYIAADGSGLRIIDVSKPTEPKEVGYLNAIGADDVVVVGYYAYVIENYRFHIIDISNPTAPYSVSYFDTPGDTQGLAVAGNYAYLANSLTGLGIIDISNPAALVETGFFATPIPDFAFDVLLTGKYAYVTDGRSGLRIIDISDPVYPLEVGFYDTPSNAVRVDVEGNYAYVADGEDGLRIIDISTPTAPLEVGFYDTPGHAEDVVVAGNYAYIADGIGGLRIIDVSDPTVPTEAGYYGTQGEYIDLSVVGNYAYVNVGGGFDIFDISNPDAPMIIGSYNFQSITFTCGAELSGNYLYAAGSDGLYIIDVSNPTAPTEAGIYNTDAICVLSVMEKGAYITVSTSTGEVHIIDISNPTLPAEAGSFITPGQTIDVTAARNYAYATNGYGGLIILRLLADKIVDSIPITGGSLVSSDGNTNLIFPSGAFSQTVNVTYRQLLYDEQIGYWSGIDHTFDISAVYSDTGETADIASGQTFTITVAYSDSEVGPALEDTLGLFSWNDAKWVREPTSTLDPVNNIITATPNHLSLWAVLGETNRVFLPMTRK